jgi:molecular chaperone GrpE
MAQNPVAGQPEDAGRRAPAGAPAESRHRPAESRPQGGEAAATETQRAEREAQERVEADLDQLAQARKERDEYLELAKRTKADFENYRKRVASEAAEALVRGKATLARELIPALDNLERALRAAGVEPEREDSGETDSPSQEVSARDALAQGVALVYRELRGSLERAGVESYDPIGERFDPELHEALSTRAGDGGDSGVVLETLDRGYRLDGQLLRPARVVVSE